MHVFLAIYIPFVYILAKWKKINIDLKLYLDRKWMWKWGILLYEKDLEI